MSYLTQAQDPRRRATALAGTAAIHVALGLAIVTGLTISGYAPFREYKPIIDIPLDPPPPPPPEPQQQQEKKDPHHDHNSQDADFSPVKRKDERRRTKDERRTSKMYRLPATGPS